MKMASLSALSTGHLYPPGAVSVRGRVDPRATVRPEGLCECKIPIIQSGIKPEAFRFVAQCLNQLHHANMYSISKFWLIPVAGQCKVWICPVCVLGLWVQILPEAGLLLWVLCCQMGVFASGWSLVKSSPTRVWCIWVWSWSHSNAGALAHEGLLRRWAGFKNFGYIVQYSRCVKEGRIQASRCMVLPSVTSRVSECSTVCFCVCKMYLFMSIHNKTENKRNLSGINLNVILKRNLTEPRI
jgi:hypothetical protein